MNVPKRFYFKSTFTSLIGIETKLIGKIDFVLQFCTMKNSLVQPILLFGAGSLVKLKKM